jgi:DNA-binding beta-propeller fold protein YncE
VIEFDKQGKIVRTWGDPSLNTVPQGTLAAGTNKVLPHGIHGCYVDYQDNVWIAGNDDGVVQKYTHNGTLLMQIGTKGVCDWPANGNKCGNSGADVTANQSHTLLNQPANMAVDPVNGDVYIADGYGNHRVVVFDKNGNYLRQWGGVVTNNGNPEPGRFAAGDGGHPHCVVLGNDGMVYVCGRADDRIQVFTKQGVLQRIIDVKPGTGARNFPNGDPGLGTAGSAWDLAFSNDSFQTFIFEADGGNETLWTMDRALGTILAGLGRTGHMAGEFTFLHSVAIDSKSNLYTGETIGGRRIQRFVPCTEKDDCNN